MPGRKKKTLVLDDPRALRALAHPARQRLIDELYAGRVLTATEAAEMVDLTPSAVSHHLRALEKWGIARRATSTGDGRERPWESTAGSITLQLSEGTHRVEVRKNGYRTYTSEVRVRGGDTTAVNVSLSRE